MNTINNFNDYKEYSSEFWDEERLYYLNNMASFSVESDIKKYKQYISDKKGLLRSSHDLVIDSISMIACGLEDLGLNKAKMAIKFAESAIEIGDFAYPNEPIEHGKHIVYRSLSWAKWILGETTWQENYRQAANYWCDYLRVSGVNPTKLSGYLKKDHVWEAVIPFLLVGDVQRAMDEYISVAQVAAIDSNKIAYNAKNVTNTIGVIILFLNDKHQDETLARDTLTLLINNSRKWGLVEGAKVDLLWKEFLIQQHVLLARLWSKYFSNKMDATEIIGSIRRIERL